MTYRSAIEAFDILDDPKVDGQAVVALLKNHGVVDASWERIQGERGHTDFVKAVIPGRRGKRSRKLGGDRDGQRENEGHGQLGGDRDGQRENEGHGQLCGGHESALSGGSEGDDESAPDGRNGGRYEGVSASRDFGSHAGILVANSDDAHLGTLASRIDDAHLGTLASQSDDAHRGTFASQGDDGQNENLDGGCAPTLGIIGRLGGIGARPGLLGFVSDGDGAAAALTIALKLGIMNRRGDILDGDVIIATHICPDAPTQPHDPVPFMGSPVDTRTMNEHEIDSEMDAIISIDTTKGNRIINHRGFAISPTVKEGWILRVSEDLLDIMSITTGLPPVTFPVTTQDITPYGNGVYHVNSIMQPVTSTSAPVIGVAITTVTAVPGCATGASHLPDVEEAARFTIEVAKAFGAGKCAFYDHEEFLKLVELYGPMNHLRTLGKSR